MNKLKNTKTVVIGPMESDNERGKQLRQEIKKELSKMNIVVWDHYNRPYEGLIEESSETHDLLKQYRENEQYEKIADYKDIRRQDLALIDRCDFVLCVFEKKTFTIGTIEELSWANRCQKPIFFVWGEGKKECPFWIFWMLQHNYIYSSVVDAIEVIRKIDSGEKEIDSKKWRLFKEEYR